MLYIHVLGGFRLLLDDKPLTAVDTPRQQALLAYLLLHRATPQPRQRLAFLFWPESTEPRPKPTCASYFPRCASGCPTRSTTWRSTVAPCSGTALHLMRWTWPTSSRRWPC